ncbi:hypothetical protein P1X15_10890 [Runella sp. MFBS21]|uniref:hypothetical protein n=1 Tax=Runella sp. MFBS21 TaxID=3034018 RepID=UPI0023F997C7|nr:hypothetical protein [Runella sp. MFBS21]MDF7818106.1 hypothetical protein [Runella sp. MFBS21]
MRLVIVNQEKVITYDFGEFTEEEAQAFFRDAIQALKFRQQFPLTTIQNEVQLRLLTDTFAKMGLLNANPEAIQEWMRPYVSNEIQRLLKRENTAQKARRIIDETKGKAFDWLKMKLVDGLSKFFSKFINRFNR